MKNALITLGLNEKQIQTFMYLVEYGSSPASEIAKHVSIPKSTVNFLADTLWQQWYLKKSFRWNTGYFEVDIDHFRDAVSSHLLKQQTALDAVIPELQNKLKFTSNKPKITFLEWLESCQQAYLELLKTDIFYEFWAHADLESAFWKKFMDSFISQRVKSGVFCDSIGTTGEIENAIQQLDSVQNRDLKIFERNQYGKISSSIAIYDDKVLILNLSEQLPMWVLIQNPQFSQTMKTIYMICKRG